MIKKIYNLEQVKKEQEAIKIKERIESRKSWNKTRQDMKKLARANSKIRNTQRLF